MKLRSVVHGVSLSIALVAAAGCNAKVADVFGPPGSAQPVVDTDGGAGPVGLEDVDRPLVPASKVDLLLVVDNSASMADKSSRLSLSVGKLLRRAAAVGDVHVGVVSTSLGNFGGDVCVVSNPETNGRAHLRTTGPDGAVVSGAEDGVLRYSGTDLDAYVAGAEALIRGAGEMGCGLEAQLEAMYRFLVQPDPETGVSLDVMQRAVFGSEIDGELLAQRKAFLRPDSALVIVMLTDEDDSAVDPRSLNGQGWAFMSKSFPGSQVLRSPSGNGTTAPRATSVCASDPGSPDCTSCGFQVTCAPSDALCDMIRNDPSCRTSGLQGRSGAGYDGYYGPNEDELNVRFHRMKERYGIDPQYPIQRYVDGLTRSVVPNRGSEHGGPSASDAASSIPPPSYVGQPACRNPIFAATLPSKTGDELCTLERGPRSSELVLFAVVGGLPPKLAAAEPDWEMLLGRNPDAYDETGIAPQMVQSIGPRPGLPQPTSGMLDRERETNGEDLQYACTFALPEPKSCAPNDLSCDCPPGVATDSPLCGAPGQQLRGKAYPTVRPLRVARGLGARAVIGSICADTYDATMDLLAERLGPRLAK